MTKRQGAALDRKKLFADPIMVTTVVVLIAFLTLFIIYPLAILLVQIHAGSGLFLWPASFVLPNALRAANDVKFTMVVSVLSMAIWRLGFSYLLCVRMGWGAVGVWIAMVIDWVCRVICFVARMKSGAWKTKYQA